MQSKAYTMVNIENLIFQCVSKLNLLGVNLKMTCDLRRLSDFKWPEFECSTFHSFKLIKKQYNLRATYESV